MLSIHQLSIIFGLVSIVSASVVFHQTPIGKFEGERHSVGWKTVDRYLGIRYGHVKERFSRPLPSWLSLTNKAQHNVRNWPVACPQQPGFLGEWLHNRESDEDCLFLNLWWPQHNTSVLLPILVFFHGGSFISESISKKSFDGAHLASQLNSIVVTVNYRLDVFGFLYAE